MVRPIHAEGCCGQSTKGCGRVRKTAGKATVLSTGAGIMDGVSKPLGTSTQTMEGRTNQGGKEKEGWEGGGNKKKMAKSSRYVQARQLCKQQTARKACEQLAAGGTYRRFECPSAVRKRKRRRTVRTFGYAHREGSVESVGRTRITRRERWKTTHADRQV